MQAFQHAHRVREYTGIPLEIGPLVFAHPEAVEVEHMQRQIALSHSFYEGVHRSFIVVRCERSRQPQAEGPCRWKRRLAGQGSIFGNNFFNGRPFNNEVFQALSSYAELGFFTFSEAISYDTSSGWFTNTP